MKLLSIELRKTDCGGILN